MPVYPGLIFSGLLLFASQAESVSDSQIEANYFEGRWSFSEDSCDLPTNWTLIAGGIFVSEDLTGSWNWQDGRLVLNLTDLALDEETGEAGGRFQMDGPAKVIDPDSFEFTIEPDVYEMRRCPEKALQ